MNIEDYSEKMLAEIWDGYDWKRAEEKIFKLQKELTEATISNKRKTMARISNKITNSFEARFLAVRQVSEKLNSAPGIDGERWVKSSDKTRAVINLDPLKYKAKPFRRFVITEKEKERRINVPTLYDRAMQLLFILALDPISEASADRKSFAFRKGRSTFDVHSLIMHVLEEDDSPDWVLICDIKSFYDSISHKWILDNIPINKRVLKEMLEAGVAFNGEIFPTNEGISLGNNISTILGNMTLDGLQKMLYDLQGKEIEDYRAGYLIRFADDILITARTKKQASIFLEEVKKFLKKRGLILSKNKTHIINVKEGFDFLSRHYYKKDGIAHSSPSENAIATFEKSLREYILNDNMKISQKKLIDSLNAKLNGFATYHRITEAREVFMHLDNVVLALLLQLMRKLYPQTALKKLTERYWYKNVNGIPVYSLPTNRNVKIILLSEIPLVRHNKLDLKKNVYLEPEYFEKRREKLEMEKLSGKYKSLWLKQNGLCYNCGLPIGVDQPRTIIYKNSSLNYHYTTNLAYVHLSCSEDDMFFYDKEETDSKRVDIKRIIEEVCTPNSYRRTKTEKTYQKLFDYFANCNKATFQLTFKDIEEIIDKKLCKTAYTNKSFWYNRNKFDLAHCWNSNGYKMKKLLLDEQKVIFSKNEDYKSKIEIPSILLSTKVPKSAKYEIESFFKYIIEKYKLK